MPLRGGEAEPFVGALGQPAIKRRIFLSLGVALLGLLTTPLLGNSSHERTEFEVDIRDGAEGLERMFRLALNRVEGMLGALSDTLVAKDSKTIERLAHSIKSASANVGAFHLATLARSLERQAHDGILLNLQEQLNVLHMEFARVQELLSA